LESGASAFAALPRCRFAHGPVTKAFRWQSIGGHNSENSIILSKEFLSGSKKHNFDHFMLLGNFPRERGKIGRYDEK
jgi:hypothetical protein